MSYSDREKSHRRTVSASDTLSLSSSHVAQNKSESQTFSESSYHSGVLGKAFNPKKSHFIQGLSSTWSGKPPKVPKPEQTQMVFNLIGHGLRDIIKVIQNDLASLKLAVESTSVSSHQIKAAERYLKKLECHLAKLDELQEKYEVQRKMRDGIRSMAYAYILSHGKERESALHNVHSGYKECNELLCSYETKLEQMMGTFVFEMIGIQGFARLCSGDVFEIIIKHGEQKWKSRGYVLKNKQNWENKKTLFKALFCEPLYIKAVEVRGLGKNIVLGNKYCETRVLFNAYPQQMTINLNPSGSLKLNIIITWNPVDGISEETATIFTRPSIFGSQSLLLAKDGNSLSEFTETLENVNKKLTEPVFDVSSLSTENCTCENAPSLVQSSSTSLCMEEMTSTSVKDMRSHHIENIYCNSFSPVTGPSYHCFSKSASLMRNVDSQNSEISSGPSANSSECNSIEMASSSENSCPNVCKLQDHLCNVIFSLENICEQYSDLRDLRSTIEEIEELLKFRRQTSYGSDVSISVKNALGCFDFLNTAVDDDVDSISNDREEKPCKTPSSEKSFVDTSENMLQSNSQSPQLLTTGFDQLDTALFIHLEYSLRLIENLGSCSALKCLENSSLEKLKKQTYYFNVFLKIIRQNEENSSILDEFFQENEADLQTFWINLVRSNKIIANTEQLYVELEKIVYSIISDMNTNIVSKVSWKIVSKILDKGQLMSENIITIGQFHLLFSSQSLSIDGFIKKIASEVVVLEDLKSKDMVRMTAALSILSSMTPYAEALFEISYLLLEKCPVEKSLAVCYLKNSGVKGIFKNKAIEIYLEGLESDVKKIRQGSCAALQILEAIQCIDQLNYVSRNDESQEVRLEAKMSLLSLGEFGQK